MKFYTFNIKTKYFLTQYTIKERDNSKTTMFAVPNMTTGCEIRLVYLFVYVVVNMFI